MKINADAFKSKPRDGLPTFNPPGGTGVPKPGEQHSVDNAGQGHSEPSPEGGQTGQNVEPTSPPQPLFTRARPVQEAEQASDAETEGSPPPADKEKTAEVTGKKPGLNWSWKRKKKSTTSDPSSSAKLPNTSRPVLIMAVLFVVGLVLGPWILQHSSPGQQPVAGPNPSVQAVADTLNASAFGSAPASSNTVRPPAEVAVNETATVGELEKPPLPAEGEQRYTAMLERMKGEGSSNQPPPQIVPKITQPSIPGPTDKLATPSVPVDPYPKEPIPLAIENTTPVKAESALIAIDRHLMPSGNYVVLRIERNQQGIPAALLMPIGGRQAIDSAWVFVGDATADGMVIENITANTVVLKTSTGRSVQIALQ